MKLVDLDAGFLKIVAPDRLQDVASRDEADGVRFLCPKCYVANGGDVGTHTVICWFRHVDAGMSPGPGRWDPYGKGLHDLSLTPSVQLDTGEGGCGWHGYVVLGETRDV